MLIKPTFRTLTVTSSLALNQFSSINRYTYQHHIIGALAESKASAIAIALQKAEMVVIEKTKFGYASDNYSSPKLSQFMNTGLGDRTFYNLSFWDIEYTYEIGQTPVGDWIGRRSWSEFEYNP
jgi:hypothetical protein